MSKTINAIVMALGGVVAIYASQYFRSEGLNDILVIFLATVTSVIVTHLLIGLIQVLIANSVTEGWALI